MSKPRWYEIAEAEEGQKEVRGGENPRILEYHSATTLKAREDEIPWCASFVCWCLEQAGMKSTKSAAAISYATFGLDMIDPQPGCIVVIRQRKKGTDKATGSSSGNHVAFFDHIVDNRIYLLGGNQSDSVKVSGFNLASYDVVAYRWPEEVK